MELRHLRYFVAVATELHFTRAARKLGIAQPPLSQQIAALERDVGFQLFERDRRSVALTRAGASFLRDAQAILESVETAVSVGRQVAAGAVGVLEVGFAASAAFHLLPRVVARYQSDNPGVVLRLHEVASAAQFELISSGRLAVGLGRSRTAPVDLICEPVLHERFIAALHAASELVRVERLSPRHLAHERFIISPRSAAVELHDDIVGVCMDAGFRPNIVQEAAEWSTVLGLVNAGMGISVVPASTQVIRYPNVVFRQLHGSTRDSVISAVASRTRTDEPLVHKFITCTKQEAGALQGRTTR